jgi:hypothetical protein
MALGIGGGAQIRLVAGLLQYIKCDGNGSTADRVMLGSLVPRGKMQHSSLQTMT